MNQLDALETVLAAARTLAQLREDDADLSDQERAELAELWEAIETVSGQYVQ